MTPSDVFVYFLIYIGWIITFVGVGNMILSFVHIPEEYSYLLRGFVGMLAVAIAATIYHFFSPLDIVFILLVGFFGVVGWWEMLKHVPYSPRVTLACMTVAFAIFAIIPLFWYRYYDTGLYHLQAMRWALEQPLQLGLANLHTRLGYNSLWFNLESVVDFVVVLKGIPYFLLNGIAVFFYITPTFTILKEKAFSSSNLFYLLTLIPVVGFAGLFLTSASPDLFVMLITFVVFAIIVKECEEPLEHEQLVFIAVALAGFAGMIKLFAFLLFFMALWLYVYRYGFKNVWATIMFIPWLIQGIATSGYIAFPLAFTRLPLIWSVPSEIAKFDADNVVAWARLQGADSFLTTLGNWNWVPHWVTAPMVILILFEITSLLFLASIIHTRKVEHSAIPTILAGIGILAWFFTAPEPRYALGFLLTMPLVVLAYAMDSQLKTGLVKSRKIVVGCFAILAILAVAQGAALHIYTHVDTPFEVSQQIDGVSAIRYGITILVDHDQAWNAPLPTTPYLDERFYYGRLKWIGMEIPINFMGIMR
jgi:hypothetical protein